MAVDCKTGYSKPVGPKRKILLSRPALFPADCETDPLQPADFCLSQRQFGSEGEWIQSVTFEWFIKPLKVVNKDEKKTKYDIDRG